MGKNGFGRASGVAVLLLGAMVGCIPALHGTLLPQLAKEGRISLPQIGQIATVESLGMLAVIIVANAWFRPRRLRWIALGATLTAVAANLATPHLAGGAIMAVRLVHGICSGLIVWVWVGFVTRSDHSGRWLAMFVTVQSVTLLVLSSLFASVAIPQGGAAAGFTILATLFALLGLLVPLVPSQFEPLLQDASSVLPNRRGWLGLFAIFTQLGAILALWVYLKPYGAQIGLAPETTGLAVSIGLSAQIFAGLVAAAIASRVRPVPLMLCVAIGSIASLAVLLATSSGTTFIAATAIFAILWMLGPPFHMQYLVDLDSTRRTAIHMTTAQLIGIAAGPGLASLAVIGEDARGALYVSLCLYGTGAVIIAIMHLLSRRRREAHAAGDLSPVGIAAPSRQPCRTGKRRLRIE